MQSKVSVKKLIMFTSDGASIILVCNNGMQAKLKSIILHLMEFYCVVSCMERHLL